MTVTQDETRATLGGRALVTGVVVGLPLSAVFLWLALRGADFGAVRSALASAEISLVGLAVLAMSCVTIGAAVRWRAVARTSSPSTAGFVEMVYSGAAVNDVVPGRVGDVLRVRWLQVRGRIAGGRALATVFVDRTFDVLTLVVFLVVSLPFVADADWLRRIALGGLALLVLIVAVLGAARLYTRRQPRERRDARGLFRRLVRDTLEGLAEPLGRRRGAALIAISFVMWSVWAMGAWLVARSVGVELSPLEAIFVTSAMNLGIAIPSSPGYIGTYEWLGVSVLTLLEVARNEALAFAILLHAAWYVPTLVVGGALLLRRGVRAVWCSSPRRVGAVDASDR